MDERTYQERMQALRREYLAEAVARADYFADAARALADLGGDQPDLRELRQAAHRLAGSAPIYGFAQLGEMARRLDELLTLVLQEEEPLDKQAIAGLAADLARGLQDAAQSGTDPS